MADVYIRNMGFLTGEAGSIKELSAAGLISGDSGYLEAEGYSQACISKICGTEFIKQRIAIPAQTEALIYCTTFPGDGCISCNGDAKKTEEKLLYAAEDYLKSNGREDVSYVGITQQGCTGLISTADLAYMKIRLGRNKNVFCVCDDVLPKGSLRDIRVGKMLLSDTVSYMELTSEPSKFIVLNILEKSVIGKSFFQIAAYTEMLLKDLCSGFCSINELENLIFPNHWRGIWNSFAQHNHLGCRYKESTIAELAHGLSADIPSNILLYEKNGCFTGGRKQAVISYGYGGHLRAMLFEAV